MTYPGVSGSLHRHLVDVNGWISCKTIYLEINNDGRFMRKWKPWTQYQACGDGSHIDVRPFPPGLDLTNRYI